MIDCRLRGGASLAGCTICMSRGGEFHVKGDRASLAQTVWQLVQDVRSWRQYWLASKSEKLNDDAKAGISPRFIVRGASIVQAFDLF